MNVPLHPTHLLDIFELLVKDGKSGERSTKIIKHALVKLLDTHEDTDHLSDADFLAVWEKQQLAAIDRLNKDVSKPTDGTKDT